jgi:methionyl-tRNA formyltransferase
LSACAPDFLVSAFFNQRLHSAALSLSKYGNFNIHPSLLPDAKGVDPVFQCLLHDTPALGVTVHFMNAEFDAGRIVAQHSIEAPGNSSVFGLTGLLFDEGAALLVGAIESLAGEAIGTPQSGAGSYQSWPTRGEQRQLLERGRALLHLADLVRLGSGRLPLHTKAPRATRPVINI